jgi:sulfide:quinone oxidoreductase
MEFYPGRDDGGPQARRYFFLGRSGSDFACGAHGSTAIVRPVPSEAIAMPVRQLTDQVSVAPQIRPEELPAIAAAGFRSVINNRPDHEADDQPTHAAMAEAASRQGLAYRYIPVVPGQYDQGTIEAMAQALEEMPPPVLAFCRTGTRSTSLWALQAARHAPVDDLVRIAGEAGYDLAGLVPRLRAERGA